jgi:O-methyltransferase involved in polyketide biosynthesis
MSLPASLHWIEADYAHIIEYKEGLLQDATPRCRLERVKIDLADRSARQELLKLINEQANGILVLTEGVVPYLTNDEVGLLAQDLRAMDRARYWIMDYFSEAAQQYRQRKRINRAMQNAPFRFKPGDWLGFFSRHGWQLHDIRYFLDESERLRRPMPMQRRLKLIIAISRLFMSRQRLEAMRRFAGYSLLEPASLH